MLTAETLSQIEGLLTSEALTVKGPQLNGVFNILVLIGQEKQRLLAPARLMPNPPSVPDVMPVKPSRIKPKNTSPDSVT